MILSEKLCTLSTEKKNWSEIITNRVNATPHAHETREQEQEQEQAGFRSGYSTTDRIHVMKSLGKDFVLQWTSNGLWR